MRWPRLVPPAACTTPIEVRLQGPPGEDGVPPKPEAWRGMCSYAEKSKWVMDARREWVQLQATALLDGDAFPGQDIAGEAVVGGTERRIYAASRGRNPDGTVNFTSLELM